MIICIRLYHALIDLLNTSSNKAPDSDLKKLNNLYLVNFQIYLRSWKNYFIFSLRLVQCNILPNDVSIKINLKVR